MSCASGILVFEIASVTRLTALRVRVVRVFGVKSPASGAAARNRDRGLDSFVASIGSVHGVHGVHGEIQPRVGNRPWLLTSERRLPDRLATGQRAARVRAHACLALSTRAERPGDRSFQRAFEITGRMAASAHDVGRAGGPVSVAGGGLGPATAARASRVRADDERGVAESARSGRRRWTCRVRFALGRGTAGVCGDQRDRHDERGPAKDTPGHVLGTATHVPGKSRPI